MMLKLACPHCQTVGVVPPLMMQAGDWPIACHYCHQHYYAPVMAGPSAMERQVEIICKSCQSESRIQAHAFAEIQRQNYDLFCSDCHASLPTSASDATLILSQSAVQLKHTNEHESDTKIAAIKAPVSSSPETGLSMRAGIVFILIGFGLAGAAILAAQEGLIDRLWLDRIMSAIPDAGTVLDVVITAIKP